MDAIFKMGFGSLSAGSGVFLFQSLYLGFDSLECPDEWREIDAQAVEECFFEINHDSPYLSRSRCW